MKETRVETGDKDTVVVQAREDGGSDQAVTGKQREK